jgi:UDP-2,3-diacylglucosamine pyrophosphatase LpxH
MLPVAFVGDSHLLPGERVVEDFERFVQGAPSRFSRLVLVGDIFDLWLARPHLHEEHQRRILAAIARARVAGLPTDYAVGNRDFGVESLPDSPFDRVAPECLDGGGWVTEHGDLVNEADTRYRSWRRFSRSPLVLGTFLRLPSSMGLWTSQWLERRMRTSNLAYKKSFPTPSAIACAQSHFARTGARFLVLGHFHQELRFAAAPGEVLVLPDWKRSRRHAEWAPCVDGAGTMSFEDSLTR